MEKEQTKQEVRQLVRIMNTDIPGHLHLRHALTKIKRIGSNLAHALCARHNLDEEKPISHISDAEVKALELKLRDMSTIDSWMLNRRHDYDTGEDTHLLTTDLRFKTDFDVKRLQKVRAYRGMRHSAGLPVRGQRTKAHFRKGRSVGVSKVKAQPAKAAPGKK